MTATTFEPTAAIRDTMPLVRHIVRDLKTGLPAHVRTDELISAGNAALVLSAQSFDQSRGVPFNRYAAVRIRGALIDELRTMDWAGRSVRARARTAEAARNRLTATLGRAPLLQDVADETGMSVAELAQLEVDVRRGSVLSLQAFQPHIVEPLISGHDPGPEQTVLQREQIAELHDAIAALPDRLRFVVHAYFFEGRLMDDIAADLGLTASRISQLCREAARQIRAELEGDAPMPQWAGSTRRTRLPANWPALVAAVMKRDHRACQLRYRKCLGIATEVDHIKPGDDHRLTNLQAVCTRCHATKSGREGAAASHAARRRRNQPRAQPHPGLRPRTEQRSATP